MTIKHSFYFLALFIFSGIVYSQTYPIVQDGKTGFISEHGKLISEPIQSISDGGNVEDLVKHVSRKHSRVNNNKYQQRTYIELSSNKESLILKDSKGFVLDEYLLKQDTLEMYFYLYECSPLNAKRNVEIALMDQYFDFNDVNYLKESGIYDERPIKFGIKNKEGKVLLSPIKLIKGLKDLPGNYITALNKNLFFCNHRIYGANDKIIIEADKQYQVYKDFIQIYKGDKHGLLDIDGEIIISYQDREIELFGDDKVILSSDGKPDQLINMNGDTLIEAEKIVEERIRLRPNTGDYGTPKTKMNNVAKVHKSLENSVYGFINSDAEWIVQPKTYTKTESLKLDITPLNLLKLMVMNYESRETVEQGLLNKSGEQFIELSENIDITVLSDEWVKIIELDNDSLTYLKNVYSDEKISLKGNSTLTKSFKCSEASFILAYEEEIRKRKSVYKNAFIYSLESKKITQKFEIVDLTMSNRQNVVIVKKKNNYFLFDPTQSKFVSPGFDYLSFGYTALPFEKNNLFIAEQNGKKGIVDKNGEWQIEPIYYKMTPFYGALALVQKDSLSFEYINKYGETEWELPEDDKTAWNRQQFIKSFKNCQPSIFMERIGYKVVYKYHIKHRLGDKNECLIQSMYLVNPNDEWTNKTMTCTYDNSLPFKEAIQLCLPNGDENECDCEGELWEIMSRHK